ncbi:Uncharacterised protein [Salmonella enterica subsp. enterica serovar Bovismorbificans]|uniref:Uncharacterized protein n=1 Tax=Salmonella enterica subsp. enterica serovar Bovismorbificans TaxID=58097 RepID=A0A655CUR1_SALET|nr:Uncharacterised protein [Salmonella enterica subsp. enterica serovar Bovismorbificans]CNU30975.1 Uncharacterised protein [Salmonella enterica subsp. enterica serovar Bovismorbificans]
MHTTQQTETLALPGGHDREHDQAQAQRQPTTGQQFIEVSREQRDIHAQERDEDQRDKIFVPVPVLTRHGRRKNRRQHHRAGHGDTIGRRQVAGVLKANDNNHDREIKQPVNERDIDLTGFHLGGMDNAHWRQIAKTHGLTRQRKDAGNDRLGGDHRRQRGQNQQRN